MQKGGKKYKRNYKKSTTKRGALSKPQKKEVKRLIHSQIEDKRFDVLYAYTNQIYNGGLVVPKLLTNIPQGITVTTRIADWVLIKSLQLRISIYHNTYSAADPQNNYRIIIFKWKQNNFVAPVQTQLIEYPSGALTLNYGIDSPYNWTEKAQDSFSILYDRSFSLSANSSTVCHNIRLNKYLGAISFEPTLLSGTGHLYLMVLNDDGVGIAPCPTMGFISRVIYEDA